MQGSKEVVGMGRQGAGDRAVRRDTRLAHEAFTRPVGNAHDERRREDGMDDVLSGAAAVRATLIDSLPSGSAIKPLKAALGQLVPLPTDGAITTNS